MVAGFGSLLLLVATAGTDSLRVLRQIQATNAQINREFLYRQRALEQIGEALYLSGSVVRDYILLDPGARTSEMLRVELKGIRDDMDASLKEYARSLRPEEVEPFRALNSELEAYWSVLNPIFRWEDTDKQERGYWFLRQEVFPRRKNVLAIAHRIASVNEDTLQEGEKRIAELFARFRRRLQIMTGIALGIGVVIAVLSISYILRLENKAARRYQESLRARGELKQLSARLVDAQEQERRTISWELHDEVGQSLSALLVEAGNLAAAAPEADGSFRQHLQNIRQLAQDSVNAVRNMSLLLRPSMLDDLGLVPALEWQVREVSKRTGLLVHLVEENVSDALPEEYKICVYRLVQEALNNCSRHAEARSAKIFVRQESERLLLTIEDDGKGFDAKRVRGLGLMGMSERVARLGGSFDLQSEPGRGVRLKVELPLAGRVVEAEAVAT